MTDISSTNWHATKTVPGEAPAPRIPQGVIAHESVTGERTVIHSRQQQVDGKVLVSALVVDVIDRRLPGYARSIDLSHLCNEGNQRSSETMKQIVGSALSEEGRLDALKTLLTAICEVSPAQIPCEDKVPRGEIPRSEEGEASRCRIVPSLRTHLGHVLRRTQSRAFAVYRGAQHLVDFIVDDRAGEIERAILRVVPAHLDLPLLDAQGKPVTLRSVNGAIHDFYSILRDSGHLPVKRSLDSVAQELDRRSAEATREHPESVERETESGSSFSGQLREAWEMFARSERRAQRSGASSSTPFSIDEEAQWQSRNLGLEQRVWFGLRTKRERGKGTLLYMTGRTDSDIPYKISVDCPAWVNPEVRRIWRTLLKSAAVSDVLAPTRMWAELPRVTVRYDVSAEQTLYPEEVNFFVERMQALFGVDSIGRGMLLTDDSRQVIPAVETVFELVRHGGRVPIWGVARSDSVAHRWSFQCFVDPHMRGRIFLQNPLGARIALHFTERTDGDENIEKTLEVLLTNPENFLSHIGGLRRVVREYAGVPDPVFSPGYGALTQLADSLWRVFEGAGTFQEGVLSRVAPWKVYPLSEERWALSINAGSDGRCDDVPVYTLVVSPFGVEEFLVSAGERSALGRLHGTMLLPQSSAVFDQTELRGIVNMLCKVPPYADRALIDHMLRENLPSAVSIPTVHMSLFDPRREEKDLVARAVRWVKQLFM